MYYNYDKNEIKENLTIDQVKNFVADLGGEPIEVNGILTCKTICHCGESHKLYYYPNTTLFKCFTDCGETFDLFELVLKVKSRTEKNWQLPQAIDYVAKYFGYTPKENNDEFTITIDDWNILNNYDRINNISKEKQIVELKKYDDSILKNLPHLKIMPWIKEGITQEAMNKRGICYDPKNCGIVIPHYDINNNLIGIRERTLIKEQEELYGKYRPAYINKKMYNHPLSFNLYNLNNSKDNIKRMQRAFVFESEKATMQYASMFGEENDISVAICGSSFIVYQAWLLISLGVKEIIIGLDKQYKELNDDEHKKLVRNLKNIAKKYGKYVKISFLFDKADLLDYKSSPTDHGLEVFMKLFKEREDLY